MCPAFGCRYSRQPLADRGEKGPLHPCPLVRSLPHSSRPHGAGGIVLTHPDLADQKISLDDIGARPTRCRAHWLRNHLPDAHTHASRREIRITLYSIMGLKALAPNVVPFAHDVERQLNEKIQHKAE